MTVVTATSRIHSAGRTASHYAHARQLLTERVREGREQAGAHERTARLLAGVADPDSALERDLALACAARARDAVHRAEEALSRLELGSYGTCQGCGGTIPAERLEVVPDATRCVTCVARSGALAGRGLGVIPTRQP